jgi:hypothetical protein
MNRTGFNSIFDGEFMNGPDTFGLAGSTKTVCSRKNMNRTANSFSVPQLAGVATRVKNRRNDNLVRFHQEVNDVRKTVRDNQTPDFSPDFAKQFRILTDSMKVVLDGSAKFLARAFAFGFIPRNPIIEFICGGIAENQGSLPLPYFASSRAFTVSAETMFSGCSRWSWRRLSINSASPGAGSTSNLSRSCSKTSRCSAYGSFFNCPNIWAALIASTYSAGGSAQAHIQLPAA